MRLLRREKTKDDARAHPYRRRQRHRRAGPRAGENRAPSVGQDQSHSIQHRRRPGMVMSLARAAGTISIDPAEARCDRNPAPREGPRHCRRLRSVTTTDEPRRAHVIILTSSFLLFEKRGQRTSFKSGFQSESVRVFPAQRIKTTGALLGKISAKSAL